ncbi:MAG: ABC transporter substrate-binding protein [Treponema sp.]|nr:ABC transporter substrate-binding protein [Treponema sp.]
MKNTCIVKICAVALYAAFLVHPIFAGGKQDVAKDSALPDSTSTDIFDAGQKDGGSMSSGTIRIGILNGPTSIPVAYLFDALPIVDSKALSFEKFASPQALLPKMLKDEIDIGFMPVNVAAKVYNSANGAIVCAGVSGNGNLFLITKDKAVHNLVDLTGKTVSIAGQGATPEYLFRWLLAHNKIPEGVAGVQLDYSIPTANIVAELLSDKIQYAVVPEPFATVATTKSNTVMRALDVQQEFSEIVGADAVYPLTVMVVSKSYAATQAQAVRDFMRIFETSYEWTVANPQKAGVLVQKHTLGLMAPIVANAIPYANFTWKDASAAKDEIENLLSIFLQLAPDSIGGKLPDESFYFK